MYAEIREIMEEPVSVKIGDTFRSVYADSNALWKVTARAGRGVYLAVIQNEPIEYNGKLYDSDYTGVEKAFKVSEIEGSKRMSRLFENLRDAEEDFFDTLEVGDIVHYNDGFNNFVRCEIVIGTEDNVGGLDRSENIGRKVMLPIGLVGNWNNYDLPYRSKDGEIHYGYHAEKIVNGTGAWRARQTCIVEAPDYAYGNRENIIDPRGMEAIDLTVPPMTDDELQAAYLENVRSEAIRILNDTDDAGEAIRNALANITARQPL